jgi:hypothetical protein
MREPIPRCAVLVAALTVATCAPAMDFRTAVSPEADLTALHSFHILPAPRVRPGVERLPANDPMLANSTANQALRRALRLGFESGGYVVNDSAPDFVVAFYASAAQRLDVMCWDYGYPWRPQWWRGWGDHPSPHLATQYNEGTVIVDVIDAKRRELLWRGQGVAVVSDDVSEYVAELKRTVAAILRTFPAAQPPVVARGT